MQSNLVLRQRKNRAP